MISRRKVIKRSLLRLVADVNVLIGPSDDSLTGNDPQTSRKPGSPAIPLDPLNNHIPIMIESDTTGKGITLSRSMSWPLIQNQTQNTDNRLGRTSRSDLDLLIGQSTRPLCPPPLSRQVCTNRNVRGARIFKCSDTDSWLLSTGPLSSFRFGLAKWLDGWRWFGGARGYLRTCHYTRTESPVPSSWPLTLLPSASPGFIPSLPGNSHGPNRPCILFLLSILRLWRLLV